MSTLLDLIGLVEKGRNSRAQGIQNVDDSIQHFDKAMNLYTDALLLDDIDIDNRLHHHAAVAFSLHAFCTQEKKIQSNQVAHDLKYALDIWTSKVESLDQSMIHETIILIYHGMDLLSLKGHTENFGRTYTLLVKLYELKKLTLTECLKDLWLYKRLSHAACVSPVTSGFLMNTSAMSCLESSMPLDLGFKLTYSTSRDFNEVKSDVIAYLSSELITDNWSKFNAGYLCHELSQRLMLNGELIEALYYAKEGLHLRLDLLNVYVHGPGVFKLYNDFWSCNTLCDMKYCSLTLWGVVQCYLQSVLQSGTIHELLGNSKEAGKQFKLGATMSNSYNSLTFSAAFLSILVQYYCKQYKWDKAFRKIDEVNRINISGCECTCSRWLKATIQLQSGDYNLSVISCRPESKSEGQLSKAQSIYIKVLKDLIRSKEQISDSARDEETPTKNMLLRFESCWNRLHLRLLIGLGKCLRFARSTQSAYKIFSDSISVLKSQISARESSESIISFIDRLGRENPIFECSHECVGVLLNFSWSYLNSYHSCELKGSSCDELSSINLSTIIDWLRLAFVLSREVPLPFQEVSRLLAICELYSSSESRARPSSITYEGPSINQWVAYFHQGSVGIHFNHQLAVKFSDRRNTQNNGSSVSAFVAGNKLRNAPVSINDLTSFVKDFYDGLPSYTNIICLSLIGDDFAALINSLLRRHAKYWVLMSRLCPTAKQPVVLLLPINSAGGDFPARVPSTLSSRVVPDFFRLTEEELAPTPVSMKTARHINESLPKFLGYLESLFFGDWKYTLRGDCYEYHLLDPIVELVREYARNFEIELNDSFVGVIAATLYYHPEISPKELHLLLSLDQGPYIGKCDDESCSMPCENFSEDDFIGLLRRVRMVTFSMVQIPQQWLPITLVLDSEIQMLPWEDIQLLRTQETYRMPSVMSITNAMERHRGPKHQSQEDLIVDFPVIDPVHLFFVMDPHNQFPSTKKHFNKWYADQQLEDKLPGIVGKVPKPGKIARLLQIDDLYVYVGHGDGSEFISADEINELDKCAACSLNGCRSVLLTFKGVYMPEGIHLNYLLAGSRFVVGTLWNIIGDFDHLTTAFLTSLIEERKRSEKESSSHDGIKVGVSLNKARAACYHRFMSGSAAVCYGVPTKMRKKRLILKINLKKKQAILER